jgi:hypothetical protein
MFTATELWYCLGMTGTTTVKGFITLAPAINILALTEMHYSYLATLS